MNKHKTIIIFENTDSQITFDGDVVPEEMINVNLEKMITEVVEDYTVHCYVAKPIEHNREVHEGIIGKIL